MKLARERLGLAQDRLGVMIGLDEGCSSARMSRYENGIHEPPTQVAIQIAEALGVPLAYLYCLDDDLAEVILAYSQLTPVDRESLKRWLRERHNAS